MGWIIILLLCIGALYQWRHTDFVKAIMATIAFAIIAILLLIGYSSQPSQQPRQVSYPTQQR